MVQHAVVDVIRPEEMLQSASAPVDVLFNVVNLHRGERYARSAVGHRREKRRQSEAKGPERDHVVSEKS